jgi:hypothetical protein
LRWELSGLHAKLYIIERNRLAHVFVGSANATDAAWGGNDEILIEMVGRAGAYGVDAALRAASSASGKNGLGALLLPHVLGDPVEVSQSEELRRTLENAIRTFAALTFTANIEQADEQVLLAVTSSEALRAASTLPTDATCTVELLTLPGDIHQHELGQPLHHQWKLAQIEDITPFLVLRLASGAGMNRVEVNSVVLARLVGDPPDRLDRLLARRIGTPAEFLRFILLLLQLAGRETWFDTGGEGAVFGSFASSGGSAGLLEAVVTAIASSPRAIDDIDRLVRRLTATEQGRKVLPEGWDAFWPAVVEARSRLRSAV